MAEMLKDALKFVFYSAAGGVAIVAFFAAVVLTADLLSFLGVF